ncbi:MAG: hydratase, partial [Firmicutes bacterium]|nr:hydratase [Bacillota bacterium]
MIKLYDEGIFLKNGTEIIPESEALKGALGMTEEDVPADGSYLQETIESAKRGTIAYNILKAHNNSASMDRLSIRFDSLTSHDLTTVGIIQTARASGMTSFPMPYVMTNCHNSLCAVGGTINEDDHMYALSAAKRYGGIYVPPHVAVMHQYMREMHAGCGSMILGSDSHTRYGALGTLAVGEGGGELVKQLLGDTWDVDRPQVIAVYLEGTPKPWVGPHDVAIALCGAVYNNNYVKNKVLEFVGPGVSSMKTDYRNGIDV